MVLGNAENLHRRLRFSDARAADVEVIRRGRFESLVHQARGEAIAISGREEDDVNLCATCDCVGRVTAGGDHFIIDVWRDDEDAVVPRRGLDTRVFLHLRVGAGR